MFLNFLIDENLSSKRIAAVEFRAHSHTPVRHEGSILLYSLVLFPVAVNLNWERLHFSVIKIKQALSFCVAYLYCA